MFGVYKNERRINMMRSMSILALLLILQCKLMAQIEGPLQKFSEQRNAMGSAFSIDVVTNDSAVAHKALSAGYDEIDRIERLISSWDPNSQTSLINTNAGIEPVKVDRELFALIYRCQKISKATDGAFDISYASIYPLWRFDGSMTVLPDSNEIAETIRLIDYRNIHLNWEDTTVCLQEKGMKIGFGAIGKGYAANRARFVIQKMGIENGLVNAGGDLVAWGKDEYSKDWGVAIADPEKEKKILAWLSASNTSIVTSGNYERFVEIDGIRYSHIINPQTGYPASGINSVTVVWYDAELADALATSVMVMGKEKGLALIDNMPGIECLIITDENELITSENLILSREE